MHHSASCAARVDYPRTQCYCCGWTSIGETRDRVVASAAHVDARSICEKDPGQIRCLSS